MCARSAAIAALHSSALSALVVMLALPPVPELFAPAVLAATTAVLSARPTAARPVSTAARLALLAVPPRRPPALVLVLPSVLPVLLARMLARLPRLLLARSGLPSACAPRMPAVPVLTDAEPLPRNAVLQRLLLVLARTRRGDLAFAASSARPAALLLV